MNTTPADTLDHPASGLSKEIVAIRHCESVDGDAWDRGATAPASNESGSRAPHAHETSGLDDPGRIRHLLGSGLVRDLLKRNALLRRRIAKLERHLPGA